MEIAALTAFLSPFLGALLERSEKAAADAAARFGEAAWDHAKQLWQRLSGRVEEEPDAKGAAEDAARFPDSASAQGALAAQLEALLAGDPALKADVERLWTQAQAAGIEVRNVTASGAGSVAVGGNVTGTTITTSGQHAPPSRGSSPDA